MSQSSQSSSRPGSVACPQASHTVHSRQRQPLLSTTLLICQGIERDAYLFLGIGLSLFLIATGPTQSGMYLYAYTVWMVALATLGTGQQTALRTQTKASADHTHVLNQNTSLVSSYDRQSIHTGNKNPRSWSFHQVLQISLLCEEFFVKLFI